MAVLGGGLGLASAVGLTVLSKLAGPAVRHRIVRRMAPSVRIAGRMNSGFPETRIYLPAALWEIQ